MHPEWLLVPLLLLPVAGVTGFCAYVRSDYLREMEAASAGTLENADFGPLGEAVGWFERYVCVHASDRHFVWAGQRVSTRLGPFDLDYDWTFTEGFPESVDPLFLSSDEVRLRIEGGTPAAELGDKLQDAAREFRDLYKEPDLDRLAVANLPAETKRFLLARLEDSPGVRAARRLIDLVEEAGSPPPPMVDAGVDGPWWTTARGDSLLWPDGQLPTYAWTERDRGRLRLVYGKDGLWPWGGPRPLAGPWGVEPVHPGWWQDALFLRWIWPVSTAALGLMLIPTLVWLAIRRQRQLDAARVRFITEIAHDLRTPLSALRVQAELLERGTAPEEKRQRYAGRIATEAAKLSRLMANLLDLTRLDRGSRAYDLERFAVAGVVGEARLDFEAVHAGRELVTEGDAVQVRADRTALRRCLDNLLDNAGKFTSGRVRVTWRANGSRVEIDVKDEGPGVPSSEQRRLFERYHRGARARGDAVPGTGLGLALARELMRGMGGDVALVPSKEGACFRLELEKA